MLHIQENNRCRPHNAKVSKELVLDNKWIDDIRRIWFDVKWRYQNVHILCIALGLSIKNRRRIRIDRCHVRDTFPNINVVSFSKKKTNNKD